MIFNKNFITGSLRGESSTKKESNLVLLEVLQLLVDVRDDGVSARGPVGRADLTVLVVELEGLDETQNFLDVTANGGLVHGDLTESLVLVVANNEQTSVNKIRSVLNLPVRSRRFSWNLLRKNYS